MNEPARKRATYADVLDAPPHAVAQVLHGVLHVLPRPRARHARASTRLGNKLGPAFDEGSGGPGGWILLDEPELHLADDVVVTDLAGWRRERMPEVPDVVFFELAPDWVCEVLSPSTSTIDKTDKLDIYARERVRHAWLVDPEARTLEVFRLEAGRWTRVSAHRDDARPRAEPFDAIELELGALWIEPRVGGR